VGLLFCSLVFEGHLSSTDIKSSVHVMSMDKWLPWQSRLQQTYRVDHSLESRHLVELLEFVSLQGECKMSCDLACFAVIPVSVIGLMFKLGVINIF
jgi:hypothetical protein